MYINDVSFIVYIAISMVLYTYVFHYLKWWSPSWGMNAGQLEAFFDA